MTAELPPSLEHRFSESDAHQLVVRLVRIEMARRGIGYRELKGMLAEIGVEIDERALGNKVARGTFSAAFLLQLCHALGITAFPTGLPEGRAFDFMEERIFNTIRELTPEARNNLPAETLERYASWASKRSR